MSNTRLTDADLKRMRESGSHTDADFQALLDFTEGIRGQISKLASHAGILYDDEDEGRFFVDPDAEIDDTKIFTCIMLVVASSGVLDPNGVILYK
jgi:hypothetical protein